MRRKVVLSNSDYFSESRIVSRYRGMLKGWKEEQRLGSERYWAPTVIRQDINDKVYRQKK